MNQEKNDKVSLDVTLVFSVLTITTAFIGLSIQIARFHSQSGRGGLRRETKIPVQELWLKMGGELMREGGVWWDSTVLPVC